MTFASSNSNAKLVVPPEARSILSKFGARVMQASSANEQEYLCRQASRELRLGDFPFVFAGVLLAGRHRLSAATSVLSRARKNAFARHLHSYLIARKSFGGSADVFKSAEPLDAWMHTSLSQREMRATVDVFTRFAFRNKRLVRGQAPVVLDVGTGNGILISHLINRLAGKCGFQTARVFLLDRSPAMLREAKRNCRRMISIPIQISIVQSTIEKLSKSNFEMLKRAAPTFAVAAGCLHHLSCAEKRRVFSLIRQITPELYMEELEANHERPDINSAELIWSVQWFYGSLLKSVDDSRLTFAEKTKCSQDFLIAEAIGILTKPKSLRGNHHAIMDEWIESAGIGGFRTLEAETKTLNKDGLRNLTFRLTKA